MWSGRLQGPQTEGWLNDVDEFWEPLWLLIDKVIGDQWDNSVKPFTELFLKFLDQSFQREVDTLKMKHHYGKQGAKQLCQYISRKVEMIEYFKNDLQTC